MISVLSTTNKYMLQPSLLDMHRHSIDWLSATVLWKREVAFFQKLLDKYSSRFSAEEDKKKVGHFQSLITYYSGELIDQLRAKLRDHENMLARTLQELNESDTRYFQEHKGLMNELEAFSTSFNSLKHDLFEFIEKAL
jgi:hypothetical protein